MKKNGKNRCRKAFPPPEHQFRVLVRISPEKVGMFRFLLEAHDHLGVFTVMDRREALLKVSSSPHEEARLRLALADMASSLGFTILPWPTATLFSATAARPSPDAADAHVTEADLP